MHCAVCADSWGADQVAELAQHKRKHELSMKYPTGYFTGKNPQEPEKLDSMGIFFLLETPTFADQE